MSICTAFTPRRAFHEFQSSPFIFSTHFQKESSNTSQPTLVGLMPRVSKVPSSHILISVCRVGGGTMMRCAFMSRSTSLKRSFGRIFTLYVCFISINFVNLMKDTPFRASRADQAPLVKAFHVVCTWPGGM